MEFVVVSRDADLPEGTVVACDDERFDDELRAREFRVAEIVDGAPLDGELWLPLGDLAWLPDGPDLRSFWAIATRRGSSSLALSREFHTVALDLAGHGDYAFLEEFELKRSVDRCVGHLRTLGVAECLVVATSLGGNAAGLLAATRPDLVAGLFLHGCTTDFSAPEIHAKFGDLNKIFDRQEAIYGDMKFPGALNSHRTPGQPPLKFEIVEDAGHYWNLEYPLMYAQRVRDMALDVFADHPRCPPR
ncbi:serine aminopeptidase [Aureococcus anophagefferens]|nr:serine aminopeptidase [Aureococcus anophagefferens]